jgi:hypothetical protein
MAKKDPNLTDTQRRAKEGKGRDGCGYYKHYMQPWKIETLADLEAFLKAARKNGMKLKEVDIFVDVPTFEEKDLTDFTMMMFETDGPGYPPFFTIEYWEGADE